MNIKKGDTVKILQGKDKGKTGKLIRVFAKKNMVLVEGMNIAKRHVKRQSQEQPGGIVEIEKPLHQSKVVKVEVKETKPKATPKKTSTTKKTK